VATPLRNPQHEAFCQYYVFGHPPVKGAPSSWREKPRHNATRSYEAAGYAARGNVATSAGKRLLRRDDIQRRIKQLEELRRKA
jgi:hypothetical protein